MRSEFKSRTPKEKKKEADSKGLILNEVAHRFQGEDNDKEKARGCVNPNNLGVPNCPQAENASGRALLGISSFSKISNPESFLGLCLGREAKGNIRRW